MNRVLTKEELLENFQKKMAEIDVMYLSTLSDVGRACSRQQREICKERTPEKWKEVGDSISHGMANMLPDVRAKWRSDLSKGVRDDYAERNLSILTPDVSEEFAEWFTGFFEGDGSVSVREKVTNNGTGLTFYPSIEFAQKDSDVVECIANSLPDAMLGWTSRNRGVYRHIKWSGQKRCVPILKLLSGHVVSNFRLLQLNEVLKIMGLSTTVVHKVSFAWLVGFWDAEGSVTSQNVGTTSLRFSVAQKDVSILYSISDFLGLNNSKVFVPDDLDENGRVATLGIGRKDVCLKSFREAVIKHSRIERKRSLAEKYIWKELT